MVKQIIIISLFILAPLLSFSQDIKTILSEIEKNNTTLKAWQELTEAQKLETHTGIFPDNPEVGFNYLWGNPSSIGSRQDFSISQSWDFPTVYRLKKQIAISENEQINLDYRKQRLSILAKAKSICNKLIYSNAMNRELQKRMEHANDIFDAYNARFETRDANILEKNKAALNLLNAKNELEKNKTERSALIIELKALNGGETLVLTNLNYQPFNLADSFDDWFDQVKNKIPDLKQTQNQIQISQNEIKLKKAENLPKFSTGYMSESVVDESFKGVTMGVSIPLWENKNTVKLAKAKKQATEKIADDAKILYYNHLKVQYEKAKNLQAILSDYKETLPAINNTDLLKKALDAGQISLIDYMLELSLYYETIDKILETEKELNQAVAALYYYDL